MEIIIVGRSLLLLLQIPLFRGENLGTGWQLGLQQTGQTEPGCQNPATDKNSKIESDCGQVLLSKNRTDLLTSEPGWGEPAGGDQEIPATERGDLGGERARKIIAIG